MFGFFSDLRYGVRLLLKSPVFTLVAVIALAVGVGANITIFGFANALLLRPLDVSDPDRLIRAYSSATDPVATIEYRDYEQYRDRNQSLSDLAMYHWGGLRPVRLQSGSGLEMIHVMPVTGNYFDTIGVSAAMGRTLRREDDKPGVANVAVLSDTCWRRHFNADPNVIGRTIVISRMPVTIVGVLPSSFTGTVGGPVVPQFYVPWNSLGRAPFSGGGQLLGRLRPGVSRAAAAADLSRIAAQLAAEQKRTITISVHPATTLAPTMIGATSWFAVLFMVVVGVVLLIACDNIAILLIARSASRRREIGIRLALGATRAQLLRQFLTESLLLSGLGGLGALAFAYATARWLTQIYLPVPMPIALTFAFDWRVVTFAVGVSLLTTLLFGLGPALQSVRTDVISSLKDVGRSTDVHGARVRSGLVITQSALSTALLVTAAVMVHSLIAPARLDKGFNSDHVVMATFHLPPSDYAADRAAIFCDQLLDRTEHLPGVVAATVMDNIPAANSRPLPHVDIVDERNTSHDSAQSVSTFAATPGQFATLGIPLLSGRDFNRRDDAGATPVGIVNETLAARLWPGESPLGKRLRTATGPVIEIVGVARDSRYESLDEAPRPFLYRPLPQQYFPTLTLLVRTSGKESIVSSAIRNEISDLDPNVVAYGVMPLDERLALSLLPNRAAAWVAGLLGMGALALGAIGTYGIMAFLAQQRRREIGIRMALGALPWDVVKMIAAQGMQWTAIGVGVGLTIAAAATTLIRRFFFGIAAGDPLAFGGIALLLSGTAFCACYLPARRASRADPLVALREE